MIQFWRFCDSEVNFLNKQRSGIQVVYSEKLKSAQRDTNLRAGCTKAAQMLKQAEPHSCKVNGNGKVILDTHPESDQHQN